MIIIDFVNVIRIYFLLYINLNI